MALNLPECGFTQLSTRFGPVSVASNNNNKLTATDFALPSALICAGSAVSMPRKGPMLSSSPMVLNTGGAGCGQPCTPQALRQRGDVILKHRNFRLRPSRTFTARRLVQAAGGRAASRSAPAGPTPSLIKQCPAIPGRQVSFLVSYRKALPERTPRCLGAIVQRFG